MLNLVDKPSQDRENNVIPFKKKDKGARMMNMEVQDVSIIVKAKLVKHITYNCFGVPVTVPAGTDVTVDLDKMVAFLPDPYSAHTDVSMDEIMISYQN